MKSPAEKAKTFVKPSLKNSELRYRRLFESAQDGILILDARTGMIEDVNPYLITMLGYSRAEFLKKKLWEVGAFKDIKASKDAFEALQNKKYIRYEDLPLKTKDGRLIQVEFVSNIYLVGGEKVIQCDIRDVTEHKRIIAALQYNEQKYHDLVNQSPDGMFIIELPDRIVTVNKAMCKELGFTEEEFLSMNFWDLFPEQYLEPYKERLNRILEGQILRDPAEYAMRGKDGKLHYVEVLSAPHYKGKDIIGIYGIARDLTERIQAEQALRQSEIRYRSLFEDSTTSLWEEDFSLVKQRLGALRQGGITNFEEYFAAHPEVVSECATLVKVLDVNKATIALLGAHRKEDLLEDLTGILEGPPIHNFRDELVKIAAGATSFGWEGLNNKLDGTLMNVDLNWSAVPGYENSLSRVIISMTDITERKQAEARMQRQLGHLTALSAIDRVISSNFELRLSLEEILKHVTTELGVDAADILILNSAMQVLEYGAEGGFRSHAIQKTNLRLGESWAGRAALDRQIIHIPDLRDEPANLFLKTRLAGEDFVCYYGLPLIAKGQVKGVLEVYHRTPLQPDLEWLDFLNTLAGQAAIAIENSTLFEGLQRSNSELALAYDATIEGWSHALDLRDKETEGHTQHVTEMTVQFARTFGLGEAELVQVRWGALLHDMGKMGVPDGILLKPGPLTDKEWIIMKKHPDFAYEMLSPIRYLRQALDIPYCHHEKWDGNGYPRGLKGEQIPLAARVFAVVDVWDALLSDRPYRKAWSEEKARLHIQAEAGTHFDPHIVEVFLASDILQAS